VDIEGSAAARMIAFVLPPACVARCVGDEDCTIPLFPSWAFGQYSPGS
jgi:hypothetical protein